jgi:sterol desaturase/sphingolipid hydroxylase (fatty acid hydroxylase superfamily)
MKKKYYHLLNACLYAACSIFILSVPLWAKIVENGLGLAFVMAAILAYLSYRNFKKISTTTEEERAYAPPIDATIIEQIKFYKRYLYVSIVAFPLLSFIIIFDLNNLESGYLQSVSLWALISFLYERFGYWTAILFVPLLGIIVIFLYIRKIYLIKPKDLNQIKH